MTQGDRLRFALFGAGRIGVVHAENIDERPDLELAWVCDPVSDAAAALASRTGGSPTASVDEVFSDSSVDAVVIASPTPTHLDLIERARVAGTAVLCEKPIDLDLHRVRGHRSTCGDGAAAVMVGFNRRFDPAVAAVRERVAAGEVGPLEQLIITSRDPAPAPDDYVAVSGGIFRDMTIHDLDLARFFVPEIVAVTAVGANAFSGFIREVGDFDSVTVTLRGAGDEVVTIVNSRHCAFGFDQRLEAFGADGMLTSSNIAPTSVRSYTKAATAAGDAFLPFFLERHADSYRIELDAFVRAVRTGSVCTPGFDDGLRALELADAALESARTGRTVSVSSVATVSA